MQNVQKHKEPLRKCDYHQLWKGTNNKKKALLKYIKIRIESRKK